MGWWIREDGKVYENPDHFNFMREHPKAFGYSAREAAAWTLADRSAVIEEATKRGWIRVRGKSPHMSFEFWQMSPNIVFNIKEFLVGQGIDPDENMLLEENASGRSWYKPAAWVITDEALVMAGRRRR